MKKILLPILMMLAIVSTSKAQTNALSVADIELPQNYEATLAVSFQFDADNTYTGYQFDLELPSDLEFVMAGGTDVAYATGSCHVDHGITANLKDGGKVTVVGLSQSSKPLIGTSGTLLAFTIKPKSTNLTVGTSYTCKISNIIIVPVQGEKKVLADGTFTVTIGAAESFDVLLDENSISALPIVTDESTIKVKRTLIKDRWQTICLPFGMSVDLLKGAFGDEYVLAEWQGYEKNGDEITMNFGKRTLALMTGVPYIIWPSKDVTAFTVENKTIGTKTPTKNITIEDEQSGDNITIASFVGTYKAETVIPNNCLFLNSSKFYYSTGKSKMKAFRAYFKIKELENTSNARSLVLSVSDDEGNTTKIDARTMEPIETGKVYNMAGQYVGEAENIDRLPNGIYIVNGKKKVVK